MLSCRHPAYHAAAPAQLAFGADREGIVRLGRQLPDAGGDLTAQHPARCGNQCSRLDPIDRIGNEAQSVKAADIGALDQDLAAFETAVDQLAVGCEVPGQKAPNGGRQSAA